MLSSKIIASYLLKCCKNKAIQYDVPLYASYLQRLISVVQNPLQY